MEANINGGLIKRKPVFINVISTINIIGAVFIFYSLIIHSEQWINSSKKAGLENFDLHFSYGTIALLGILSGVGMFFGRKWGWWLGSFYYIDCGIRNLSRIILSPIVMKQLNIIGNFSYYFLRDGVKAVFCIFVIIYLFKKNVLEYFGLYRKSKFKYILIFIGINIMLNLLNRIL